MTGHELLIALNTAEDFLYTLCAVAGASSATAYAYEEKPYRALAIFALSTGAFYMAVSP